MSDNLPTFASPHPEPDTLPIDLGPLSAFPPNTPRLIPTSRGPVLVFLESPPPSALIHVYLAICPHMGNHLREQDCSHGAVLCNLHNWEFDLRTGQALNPGFRATLPRLQYTIERNHLIAHLPPEPPDPMGH